MSSTLLMMGALSASYSAVLRAALDRFRKRQREKREQPPSLPGDVAVDALPEMTDEEIEAIERAVASAPKSYLEGNPVLLSREAVKEGITEEEAIRRSAGSPPQRELGTTALALDSREVFDTARKRIDLVFKLNLILAVTLAVILIVGVAGAVISAVFLNQSIWALVFGGVSVADVVGALALKPLKAVNSAIVSTQRLEVLHLGLQDLLDACRQHESLEVRIDCLSDTYDTMHEELAKFAA